MSLTRIGSIGINTGIAFAGVTTIVTLNTANDALSIGATVNVGSGITLGASGDIFFTGIATGNGSGLTALNATQLTSGTVPTARLGSGTASSSTFLRGDSTFQTVNTDLVSDTSPQLGGDLDTNDHNILLDDSHFLKCGNDTDLQIGHTGSQAIVANTTGAFSIDTPTNLQIRNASGSEVMFKSTVDGAVDLYYDNSLRLSTTNVGVNFGGNLSTSSGGNFEVNAGGQSGTAGNVLLRCASENAVVCNANGSVDLYHDNELQALTAANGLRIKTAGDTDTELSVVGPEGRNGIINLEADDGDDNADIWGLVAATDGTFLLRNYASGSYETNIKATGNDSVELYHDNVKKLDTISTGIRVHGSEGGDAQIQLLADEGDDNADYWRFVGGTGGGLDIASYSSGSWVNHISVNPDGEVQKPNNPAASVWTSSNEQGGHNNEVSSGYLKNGNETFDVSNDHGLVSSIGRFTCPVDGRYRVSFFTNVSVDGLTGDAFNVNVTKNGSTIHLHYDQKEASSWQYIAFSDLIDCSANDYLQIFLKAGNGSSQGTIGVDGSNSQWNSTFYELVA